MGNVPAAGAGSCICHSTLLQVRSVECLTGWTVQSEDTAEALRQWFDEVVEGASRWFRRNRRVGVAAFRLQGWLKCLVDPGEHLDVERCWGAARDDATALDAGFALMLELAVLLALVPESESEPVEPVVLLAPPPQPLHPSPLAIHAPPTRPRPSPIGGPLAA